MRLDRHFRRALYAVVAVLLLTGVGWLLADQMKEGASGESWQSAAANLLMLHGGAAMLALMLFGALLVLHVQRAWRSRRNRATGTAMLAVNGVLIATAFALYYASSELLRPLASLAHIGFGIALPALFVVHVLTGRRSR